MTGGKVMSESNDMSIFIQQLLQQAGITQLVRSVRLFAEQGITNRMSLVTLNDGTKLVLRFYQWAGVDYDRLRKEKFLHQQLQDHGVPVARFLADGVWNGSPVALLDYLPGKRLGDEAPRLDSPDCDDA